MPISSNCLIYYWTCLLKPNTHTKVRRNKNKRHVSCNGEFWQVLWRIKSTNNLPIVHSYFLHYSLDKWGYRWQLHFQKTAGNHKTRERTGHMYLPQIFQFRQVQSCQYLTIQNWNNIPLHVPSFILSSVELSFRSFIGNYNFTSLCGEALQEALR